jgi:hypothetical protein
MITSKSLQRSNVAFVFSETGFKEPENQFFASLYGGTAAKGSRFLDDPTMRVKFLSVPSLNLKFVLEGTRFRVDDDHSEKPQDSKATKEGMAAAIKLFPGGKLASYGFNFDIYYRFDNAIPMRYFFSSIVDDKALAKKDIRDFGIQFTLEKTSTKQIETYFLKVTGPIELAVHANFHIDSSDMPTAQRLQDIFEKGYEEVDDIIKNLKI